LLVPDAVAIDRHLRQFQQRLVTVQRRQMQARSQRLDHALGRFQAQRPQARLQRDRERLQHLRLRLATLLREQQHLRKARLQRLHSGLLAQHPRVRLPLLTRRLAEQDQRLRRAIAQALERRQTALRHAGRALHAISPLATLDRGYAILFDSNGKVLRSVQSAPPGSVLRARLADGELGLRVEQNTPAERRE
jgi:exodeoxyribonuclease VII large subunit